MTTNDTTQYTDNAALSAEQQARVNEANRHYRNAAKLESEAKTLKEEAYELVRPILEKVGPVHTPGVGKWRAMWQERASHTKPAVGEYLMKKHGLTIKQVGQLWKGVETLSESTGIRFYASNGS